MPTNAINDTGVKYLYDKLHCEIEPVAEAVSTDTATVEGNPINFSTKSAQNASSTIIDLEPIQDLHGYDKPWVGGAGKNLLPMTLDGIKTVNTIGTWSGNAYTLNNTTFTIMVDSDNNVIGIKINSSGASATASLRLTGSITANYSGNVILNGSPTGSSFSTHYLYIYDETTSTTPYADTGSGTTINASNINGHNVRYVISVISGVSVDNKIFYPMIRLSTETDATFQPYTNECGISGRTEIPILGCGKNWFDYTTCENRAISQDGSTYSISTRLLSDYIDVVPNKSYTVTIPSGIILAAYVNYDISETFISRIDVGETASYSFIPQYPKIKLYLHKTNTSADISKNDVATAQLEYGTLATTYSPYTKSNDLTINLGQTVYGCHYSVENGVLVVDRKYVTITSMTRNSATAYYANVSPVAVADDFTYIKSDRVETSDGEGVGIFSNWMGAIRLNTPIEFDNASDMMAFYGNEINVCYKLATPITIQLTPNEISLLEGANNISTDGDKITLTYRDGSVATLGDIKALGDNLTQEIADSQILTDTVTGDKYKLVVTNGTLSIEQISN